MPVRAFVLRHDGRAVAYLNRCAHVPAEMDWLPGEFLDSERSFIICSIHGATYLPRDGRCLERAVRPRQADRAAGRGAPRRGLLVSFRRYSAGSFGHRESPMSSSDNFPPTSPPPLDPVDASRPPAAQAGSAPWSGIDHVVERFARDYIRDRRSERRWRIFFA